uniref:Uncharacterized protein n=1 Tax=Marseillevirus LCMAC101 TaxID=2506602 RepID=A0A481YSH1_9VIRU|nr:MAG: hypothetical protein LCMAC101_00030 [Marseillevirus LCMAC101]
MANNNLWIILCMVILVGIIVYFCAGKTSSFSKGTIDNKDVDTDVETDVKIENFQNAAGIDNLGAILSNNYNLMQDPGANVPANFFADLVQDADAGLQNRGEAVQPNGNSTTSKPMERLARVGNQSLMPRTSENLTPFSTSLADSHSYKYSVNPPRVQLKGPLWRSDLYTSLVGDGTIIKYNRNVPLISTSRFGRESQKLDGVFSCAGRALYSKYVGSNYKSMPLLTAGAGQAGGYGGSSGETIMDNYS